ncbi:MAG: aspartate aminotransferase family protein [Syntrophobacteraceae bacterium CG2_30_61_12]|nr:MAG: aspartate aminotransferase family protein [Syntrophobacteraceae bacterium CG2_30_61_12]
MTQLIETCNATICRTYARLPVLFVRGEGCRLWDDTGKEYLDFLAGIAVCNLGHSHPLVARAVCEQATTLVHVSNLFYTRPQIELARELTRRSFADKVFFANSGAEANEAAIKLARKYSRDHFGPGRFHIIAMTNSFHGRTLATLSATGQAKVHKGFEPLVEGFSFVPFDSVEAVRQAVTEQTCAVLVEPIQGEGGVRFPSRGYLRELKEFCRAHNLLLIFDEVQVGMGRTGTLFAHEQEEVNPDILTLAKALANGLPIGAMLTHDAVAEAFSAGTHATTFGGTPLVTRAALTTLEIIAEPDFLERVRSVGTYFLQRLTQLKEAHACVREVRGRGLLLAVELDRPAQPVVEYCLEQGFVINCVQDSVIRLAPPLIVEEDQIDRLLPVLDRALSELEAVAA